jgi:hypothetical protein
MFITIRWYACGRRNEAAGFQSNFDTSDARKSSVSPLKIVAYLFTICTNPEVDITERTSTDTLGNAVFLWITGECLHKKTMLVIALSE